MVIVLVGIMSAVAVPRLFGASAFQSRGFADQIKATLRYAQKMAIAQNRFVCAAFTINSLTLTISTTATCPGSNFAGPAGLSSYVVKAPGSVVFSSIPGSFSFDTMGRPSVAVFGVIGNIAVTVEAETGYVH